MFDLYFSFFKIFVLVLGTILLFVFFVGLLVIIVTSIIDYIIETKFERKYQAYKEAYLKSIKQLPSKVDKELRDYVKSNL